MIYRLGDGIADEPASVVMFIFILQDCHIDSSTQHCQGST